MEESVYLKLKNHLIAGTSGFFRSAINLITDKNELFTLFEDILNNADTDKKNQLWGNIYRYLAINFTDTTENSFSFLIDYIIAYKKQKEFADSFNLFCRSLSGNSYSDIHSHFIDLFIDGNATHKKFIKEEVIPELKKQNNVVFNILLYVSLNNNEKLINREWPELAMDDFLFRDKKGLNVRFSTLVLVENLFSLSVHASNKYALLLDKQSVFMESYKDSLRNDHKVYFHVYNFLAEHLSMNKDFKMTFCNLPFDYEEDTFDYTDKVTLETYRNLFTAKNIGGKFDDYLHRLKSEADRKMLNEIIVSETKKENQARL